MTKKTTCFWRFHRRNLASEVINIELALKAIGQFPLEKQAFYPLNSCMGLLGSEQNIFRASSENVVFNVFPIWLIRGVALATRGQWLNSQLDIAT